CLEPFPGAFGPFAWLWFHQPTTHENSVDRRNRRHRDRRHPMAEMPEGRGRTVIQPGRFKPFAFYFDRLLDTFASPRGTRQRTPRSFVQPGQTLGPVAGRPLVERLARHAPVPAHR